MKTEYGEIIENNISMKTDSGNLKWLYTCFCGKQFWTSRQSLLRRKKPSCGCKRIESLKSYKPNTGNDHHAHGVTPVNAMPKGTITVSYNGRNRVPRINGFDWKSGACHRTYSRYVMEQHLGRKLSSKELVWHIDCDSMNNDVLNLEIIDRRENARRICQIRHHGNYSRDLPDVI